MANGSRTDARLQGEIIAQYKLGKKIYTLSQEYRVPASTIRGWLKKNAVERVMQDEVLEEAIFDHMVAGLAAMTAITKHVSQATYLNKQKAGDVAALLDSIASNVFQLLEAMQPTGDEPGGADRDSESEAQEPEDEGEPQF